jgi:poly-gamma-glutamate synthesis protein (capsule biosynthesis protein)
VSVHGGTEYVTEPDPWKTEIFREMVAHGADIVWGHHPHVLQPVEYVHTGATRKLIMHSTGNFISAQRRYQQPTLPVGRWAPTGDTALFRVMVTRNPARQAASVTIEQVWTPILTVYKDPVHGYVLRRFGTLLTTPLSLEWRAFYVMRYAVTRSFLSRQMESFVPLCVPPGDREVSALAPPANARN